MFNKKFYLVNIKISEKTRFKSGLWISVVLAHVGHFRAARADPDALGSILPVGRDLIWNGENGNNDLNWIGIWNKIIWNERRCLKKDC